MLHDIAKTIREMDVRAVYTEFLMLTQNNTIVKLIWVMVIIILSQNKQVII